MSLGLDEEQSLVAFPLEDELVGQEGWHDQLLEVAERCVLELWAAHHDADDFAERHQKMFRGCGPLFGLFRGQRFRFLGLGRRGLHRFRR